MNRAEVLKLIEHFLDYAALNGELELRLCHEDTAPEGGEESWQRADWPEIERAMVRFCDQEGIG